jgi:hypothetical protein
LLFALLAAYIADGLHHLPLSLLNEYGVGRLNEVAQPLCLLLVCPHFQHTNLQKNRWMRRQYSIFN